MTVSPNKDKQEWFNNLIAVVVLYKCAPNDSITLQSINAACIKSSVYIDLLIYDNSPNPQKKDIRFSNVNVVKYISDTKNPGVGVAYNFSWEFCQKENRKWLLLLDQDTRFPNNYIDVLANSIQKQKHINIFAAAMQNTKGEFISPCKHWRNWNFPLIQISSGEHKLTNYSLINSGLVLHMDTLAKVGGFHSELPLDFSDAYLMDKLRADKHHFYLMNVSCEHHLSSEEKNFNLIKLRYLSYLKSSKIYAKTIGKPVHFKLFLMLRAFKLSIKHRSLFFVKSFIQA